MRRTCLQKSYAGRTIEVPDGAPQKKHKQMLHRLTPRGDFRRPSRYSRSKPRMLMNHVAQFALAHGQRRGRNFDGAIRRSLAPAQGFKNPPRLFAAAAAQFRHNSGTGNVRRYRRASPQQAAHPRESAHTPEGRRSLRTAPSPHRHTNTSRAVPSAGLGESSAHVCCKFKYWIGGEQREQHSKYSCQRKLILTQRKPA